MKITSIEIDTDQGKRTVNLANYIEVDPTLTEAPDVFCELAIMLWECVRRAAEGRLTVGTSKPS
jgi:hypothetical protein